MRTILSTFIAITFFTVAAAAHPLGNFSVNQYSRIEVENKTIKIRYVVDMAEIPTFQLKDEIDADKNGELSKDELYHYKEKLSVVAVSQLSLALNGSPLELKNESSEISVVEGAGNLPTLRLTSNLYTNISANADVYAIKFENNNFADRIGWNEIVINRSNGVTIFDSNAFGSGVTDELKAYPADTLDAPLTERSAEFKFTNGELPANARMLQNRDGHASAAVEKDRLAELISVPEITPAIALVGLLIAIGFGALHAMSPGHGKTVVGAYLVGSRGTVKHAVFLGLTVTITHTLGVFALGLITLFASNFILPETILPFLSFVSGMLVLYIGVTMFKSRLFAYLGWETAGHHHDHSHDHDNEHSHGAHTHTHDGHTHSHLPPEDISWKSLLALGVSGGLLPCPSALVLMLSAISLGRIGYGLVLTTAFSFGLAATLTAVGLAFLFVGKAFSGSGFAESRLFKALPVFSAFVIACLGAAICYNSVT